MGHRGPAPKPEGERRRRNKPAVDSTTIIEGDAEREIPSWPKEYGPQFANNPDSVEVWHRLWAEPISAHWRSFDRDGLARLCLLYANVTAGLLEDDKSLGRMRELEDRYGLSPKARQQLRWLVAEEDPAPVAQKTKPSRYASLSVVSG